MAKRLNKEKKEIIYELVNSINMGGRDLSAEQIVQLAYSEYGLIEAFSEGQNMYNMIPGNVEDVSMKQRFV